MGYEEEEGDERWLNINIKGSQGSKINKKQQNWVSLDLKMFRLVDHHCFFFEWGFVKKKGEKNQRNGKKGF